MSKFRSCGECTACCTWLVGDAFGHQFGNGKSCKFLECDGCSVHKAKPEVCREYQCAWSQYLLPEEMRPDKSNVLVSVEQNENGQYLRVLSINNVEIDKDTENFLLSWGEKMNTPVIFVRGKIDLQEN